LFILLFDGGHQVVYVKAEHLVVYYMDEGAFQKRLMEADESFSFKP
jgi:hypothetical protein